MLRKNIKLLCVGSFLLLNSTAIAQTNNQRAPLNIHTQVDKVAKKATLEFEFPVEEDVLVLVTDSAGITVFLENKYRFKGKYKREIDLPGKGPFQLKVSRMNENINRTLDVK